MTFSLREKIVNCTSVTNLTDRHLARISVPSPSSCVTWLVPPTTGMFSLQNVKSNPGSSLTITCPELLRVLWPFTFLVFVRLFFNNPFSPAGLDFSKPTLVRDLKCSNLPSSAPAKALGGRWLTDQGRSGLFGNSSLGWFRSPLWAVQPTSTDPQRQSSPWIRSSGSIREKPQGSAGCHESTEATRGRWNITRSCLVHFPLGSLDKQRPAKKA